MRPTVIAGIANLAVIAVLALSACDNQQELCFDHNHDRVPVEVVFDWSECPDAEPSTMSLYLFSEEGYRRYEFKGHRGGTIMITPGRYSAIAVNSDTERTAVRNTSSIETFEIWLREDFAVGQQRAGDPLCNQSDFVWAALMENIKCEGNDSIVVEMHEVVCHCTVDVLKLSDCADLRSVNATLSGMNESIPVYDRHAVITKNASIGFVMERPDGKGLHGSLLTLGHCGRQRSRGDTDCELPHILSLYFNFEDGTSCVQTVDVAEQIHNQSIDDCHIIVDSVAVPDERPMYGGGFRGTVSDWEEGADIIIKP